jgi:hypothetical protein
MILKYWITDILEEDDTYKIIRKKEKKKKNR